MLNKDLEKKMKKVLKEAFGSPDVKMSREGYRRIDFNTMKFSPEAMEIFTLLKSKNLTPEYIKKDAASGKISLMIKDSDFLVAGRKENLSKILNNKNKAIEAVKDSQVDEDGYFDVIVNLSLLKEDSLVGEKKYWAIKVPYDGVATIPMTSDSEPEIMGSEVSSLLHTNQLVKSMDTFFRDKGKVESITETEYNKLVEEVKKKKPVKEEVMNEETIAPETDEETAYSLYFAALQNGLLTNKDLASSIEQLTQKKDWGRIAKIVGHEAEQKGEDTLKKVAKDAEKASEGYGKDDNYKTWKTLKEENIMEGEADNKQVATTILNQLGGMGRLKAMIGADHFAALSDKSGGVSFKFPNKQTSKPNYIKILLNAMDTYDVTFGRISGMSFKELKTVDGIYEDSLKGLIEKETGLYLSLEEAKVNEEVKEEPKKDEVDKALEIKDPKTSIKKLRKIKFMKLKAKIKELKEKKKKTEKPAEKKVIDKKVEKIEKAIEQPVKKEDIDPKTFDVMQQNSISDMHESKKPKKELTLKEAIQLKLKKIKKGSMFNKKK